MKKTICFYFEVHLPFKLRQYRFFDIGNSNEYFDEFNNRIYLKNLAKKCYIPMNNLLLELIENSKKKFKVAFSISGLAVEQFERYAPEVLESFQKLAKTGCVEFITETYAHSLAMFKSDKELELQVKKHKDMIKKYFGQTSTTFRFTELIYSDEIANKVSKLGYNTILTEGARHILGWRSPNYLYSNAINSEQKVFLRNFRLSDDIALRFSNREWSEWPLTANKYSDWIKDVLKSDEIVNVFMSYETFGNYQEESSGIFFFMKHLPQMLLDSGDVEFLTPKEASKKHIAVSPINVPQAISWADEERDLSPWLGNNLQNDAFNSLYKLADLVHTISDESIQSSWLKLQASDHFRYMSTKWLTDGSFYTQHSPYDSPYMAYVNYMNVLSDFDIRVKELAESKATKPVKAKPETAKTTKVKSSVTKVSTKKADETVAKTSAKSVATKVDKPKKVTTAKTIAKKPSAKDKK